MAHGGSRVNIIKLAFEAMFGILFIVVACNIIANVIVEGNFSDLALYMTGIIDVVLIAIYLYALAKNAGLV